MDRGRGQDYGRGVFGLHSRRGKQWRHLVALLALLGLFGRAAAPVLAMPMLSAALLAGAGICHADSDGQPPAGAALDCNACQLCHAVAQSAALPAPADMPPLRSVAAIAALSLPPAGTGPPAAAHPFRSRAPPAFS